MHWLLLIKLCRWLTHSLRFCSRYYLPTGFCASPSWFLTSFLASGFFASLSRHPLSQVHQRPLFHLQRPDLGLHCPCTSCILNYRCNPFSSERFSFLNHSFLELSSFLIYLIKLISWNCYSVTWNTVAVVSCIFLFRIWWLGKIANASDIWWTQINWYEFFALNNMWDSWHNNIK